MPEDPDEAHKERAMDAHGLVDEVSKGKTMDAEVGSKVDKEKKAKDHPVETAKVSGAERAIHEDAGAVAMPIVSSKLSKVKAKEHAEKAVVDAVRTNGTENVLETTVEHKSRGSPVAVTNSAS